MVLNVERIIVGEVGNAVVSKAVATKLLRISVQHHFVRTCWHEEAIVSIRACGREVEDKHQVATHIAEYLVAVVVPYLLNRCCLEILLALNHLKHLSIKIS